MAEDDDDSQKTEDPSQKRLNEAREQGNLPISRDLATWMTLLGIVISSLALFPPMTKGMMAPLTAILEKSGEIRLQSETFGQTMGEIFDAFALPVIATVFLFMAMGVAGWLMQTGMFFNMSILKLKWERLNPQEGIKKLFSMNSVVELIKSIAKMLVIGSIAYTLIRPVFFQTKSLTGIDNLGLVATTYDLSTHILFAIFLGFTIIAGVDVLYQRFTYFKNLRMTKAEVKEEFRQTEGDPHVKGRLRQIRQEKARKRMMAAVPTADVVVTNPTHFAVALKYETGEMRAPVVVAKGQDFIAAKIREIAKEHDVPLVSNPPLARALYAAVEVDEEIPSQHYRAVAEVISFVYKLKKGIKR